MYTAELFCSLGTPRDSNKLHSILKYFSSEAITCTHPTAIRRVFETVPLPCEEQLVHTSETTDNEWMNLEHDDENGNLADKKLSNGF
ncbi:hypothetical protein VTP01DRAFT_3842 [Rhizomucor pusillus]|uniref:uncharacterized protein n=1 Tax=Rhizomucor pusillus TaxID=4840 RepID=UPI003743A8FC